VIVLALLAATLPFLNERVFAVLSFTRMQVKPFWLRLLELLALYLIIGFAASFLEAEAGNHFEQQWEFYAVTVCMFLVFAFPGFVFQYLRKQKN
jgi:hypothetical protein